MAYDEAVSLFKRILGDEYKREGVRPHLAYAYDRLGRTDQAILVLDTESRIRPGNLTALSLSAYLLHKAGRVEEAERFSRIFDAAFEKIKDKPKTRAAALKAFGPNAGIPAVILGLAAGDQGRAGICPGLVHQSLEPRLCSPGLLAWRHRRPDSRREMDRSAPALPGRRQPRSGPEGGSSSSEKY